ncbi:hypothetical protein TNCV_1462351 [Trichonephila clavipes]|nr:hypothetical protein TNCV_1462351 [Trichonephila clavipes]
MGPGKRMKHSTGFKIKVIQFVQENGNRSAARIQMNSLAASVKLTYSASMVDRLTDFCLKVRHEIGVSSIKVMNPPIDTFDHPYL